MRFLLRAGGVEHVIELSKDRVRRELAVPSARSGERGDIDREDEEQPELGERVENVGRTSYGTEAKQ